MFFVLYINSAPLILLLRNVLLLSVINNEMYSTQLYSTPHQIIYIDIQVRIFLRLYISVIQSTAKWLWIL